MFIASVKIVSYFGLARKKPRNTMSLLFLISELSDNVQEFCYIITDIFRINEMWKFCDSGVKSLQTHLFEKLGHLIDRNFLHGGHLENAVGRQISFNHHIFKSPQSLGNQKMQALLMTKISSRTKSDKRKHKSKTSTPLHYNKDTENSFKVMDLEYRLFTLEQEMRNVKEQIETLCQTKNYNDNFLAPIPGVVEPHLFPPPPLPPPPPTISKKTTLVKKSCIPLDDHNIKIAPQKLDMVTLLKGLKDVKLKPTDRSPGGTPVRKKKPASDNHMDMLQEVLRKRFQSIHPVEIHNKENIDDSWEISPNHSLKNEL